MKENLKTFKTGANDVVVVRQANANASYKATPLHIRYDWKYFEAKKKEIDIQILWIHQLALAFGNYEEANKYVQKGYESILIEEGKKGPRTQEYMKCLAKKIKPELLVQNILAIT